MLVCQLGVPDTPKAGCGCSRGETRETRDSLSMCTHEAPFGLSNPVPERTMVRLVHLALVECTPTVLLSPPFDHQMISAANQFSGKGQSNLVVTQPRLHTITSACIYHLAAANQYRGLVTNPRR